MAARHAAAYGAGGSGYQKNGLPVDPNAANACIAEYVRLHDTHAHAQEKEEWRAANQFFFEAKRRNEPYHAYLHMFPPKSTLERQPLDLEANEILLHVLKLKWAALVERAPVKPLLPPPAQLYARQAALLNLSAAAAAANGVPHRCAGKDLAGAQACDTVCFAHGQTAYSFLLGREFVASGTVFVCDRTGAVHVCGNGICSGDMRINGASRFCSVSRLALNMPEVKAGGLTIADTHKSSEWELNGDCQAEASVDACGEWDPPPFAVAATEPPPPPGFPRLLPSPVKPFVPLRPPPEPAPAPVPIPLLLEPPVAADEVPETADGRKRKRLISQLESRAVHARLIGTQTPEADLRASFDSAMAEARAQATGADHEAALADTLFQSGASALVLMERQKTEDAEEERRKCEKFVSEARSVVMKRRARHDPSGGGGAGKHSGPKGGKPVASGQQLQHWVDQQTFDVVKRERLLAALADTVSDLLCGPAALALRASVLAKAEVEATRAVAAYVNKCFDEKRPVVLTTLLAYDCAARDRDAWCPARAPTTVDWTGVDLHYTRLLIVLWDRLGPFIYAAGGKRGSAGQLAMGTSEPARFAVGFLYYMATSSFTYTEGDASVVVLPGDRFLQRYLVRQAQLAQLKGRQGHHEYQQSWVYQLNKMIEMALGVACKEYSRRGRLHELAYASLLHEAARVPYQPRFLGI